MGYGSGGKRKTTKGDLFPSTGRLYVGAKEGTTRKGQTTKLCVAFQEESVIKMTKEDAESFSNDSPSGGEKREGSVEMIGHGGILGTRLHWPRMESSTFP